ncbi:MAG: trypsin-like serine protease [Myxococcota bacterium]
MLMTAFFLTGLAAAEPPPPPVINGTETADFTPVGTLMLGYNGDLYSSFCSGTLATPDGVITAAHCADAAVDLFNEGYEIYFCTGSTIYGGLFECALGSEVYNHPNYDAQTLQADIAVLLLAEELTASGTYPLNTDEPDTFTDLTVTYVGWGSDSGYGNSDGVGVKRTVDIDIFDADSNFVYTYGEDRNVCSGDSGGAALMWDGGRLELVGVNSFVYAASGDGCTGEQAIAGAVRVDAYYDWIGSIIELADPGDDPVEEEPEEEDEAPADDEPDSEEDVPTEPAPQDTGSSDTGASYEPGDAGAVGVGCSSAPLRVSGVLGLTLLGAALIVRREHDERGRRA